MSDSTEVMNSNSEMSSEARADFRRKLAYDPAALKRRGLWSKSDISTKDTFGQIGKNRPASTMMSHQGDRSTNPPDSKHKAGDTQKYNSDSRSHGERDNNGSGTSKDENQMYSSQSMRKGSGGLDDAKGGQKWNSDSHSHSERDNNGAGVRADENQMYGSQASKGAKTGLRGDTSHGRSWNGDSRSHTERDGN